MNLSLFIFRKIVKADKGSFSSVVNVIAVISIALGLAIMLVSFLILGGFQNTIRDKIYGFNGHIQITKYTISNSLEEVPMADFPKNRENILKLKGVTHLQKIAHKPGLLTTKEEVQGIVLKGVGRDFNVKLFKENLVEGSFIDFKDSASSNDVLISTTLSKQLNLKVNDGVIMYFVQTPVRRRKVLVKGIYETSMEEFDKRVIIGDISLIQRLNNWSTSQVGGYEVFLTNEEEADLKLDQIADLLSYDFFLEKVSDRYLQIFDWLQLLNQNMNIFLGLILIVACVNIIAILLILIMERTQMIGVLKALGANNRQIRGIFFYNGFWLVVKGMLIGNVVGLGIGFVQDKFRIITLDPQNYYMKFVPIFWDWQIILFLNLLVLGVVSVVLVLPTILVTRINPVKAIKFD